MRTSLRATYAVVAGCLLFQSAWILALQPFRGMDEWDHVYRAGSVAEGYWHVSEVQPGSRHGQLIPVPDHLVEAATPVCEEYPYVARDNCRPVEVLDSDLVTVASGAAYYNPLFYAVIGTAAEGLQGVAALYGMRIAAALLCAGLIGLTAWAAQLGARTPWPTLGILLCLTPTTLYTTVVPAPNGLEIVAGLAVWASLVSLKGHSNSKRAILSVLAISAALLALLRVLGPLWLGGIFLAFSIATPLCLWTGLWRRHRRVLLASSVLVGAALLAGFGYSAAARTNAYLVNSPETRPTPDAMVGQLVVWFYQCIAAFPNRSQPAPTLVYALVLVVWIGLLTYAWHYQTVRERLAQGLIVAGALAVGTVVTVYTFSQYAFTWQGRYFLPLVIGVVMIAAGALDRADALLPARRWVIPAAVVALGVAQTVSILAVLAYLTELDSPPNDPNWATVPAWAIAALGALATASWWHGARLADRVPRQSQSGAERMPDSSSMPGEGVG